MAKKQFLISGNIIGERVRIARAIHNPSLSQKELATKVQFLGLEMTAVIVSRIEQNQRHVCDAELFYLAKALGVSMDWLCGEGAGINV